MIIQANGISMNYETTGSCYIALNLAINHRYAETITTWAFSPGFRDKNPSDFQKYLDVKLQNNPHFIAKHWEAIVAETNPPDLISAIEMPDKFNSTVGEFLTGIYNRFTTQKNGGYDHGIY